MADEGQAGDGSSDCPDPSGFSNAEDQNKSNRLFKILKDANDRVKDWPEWKQSEDFKKAQEENLEKNDKRIKTGNWSGYRRRIKELRSLLKKCPNCGLEYAGGRKNRIYCSRKCRQEKFLASKDETLKNKIAEIIKKETE